MLPFYIIKRILPLKRKIAQLYQNRALQIIPKIEPLLSKDDAILDIGCGTATIAKLFKKHKYDITLSDVAYNDMCDIFPVIIYDGKRLPFKDRQFSTALLIAVLHHCQDYSAVLDEAIRVSSKKIIVMEDIFTDLSSRIVTFIGDCLVNWEIHSPFTNHTRGQWERIFKSKKLKIVSVQEFQLRCIGFPFKLAIFELTKP